MEGVNGVKYTAGGRKRRELFSGQCVDVKGTHGRVNSLCVSGFRAMRSKLHNSLNAQGNSQQAGLPTLLFDRLLPPQLNAG